MPGATAQRPRTIGAAIVYQHDLVLRPLPANERSRRGAIVVSALATGLFFVYLISSVIAGARSSIILICVGATLVFATSIYSLCSLPQTLTIGVHAGMLVLRRSPRELRVPIENVSRVLEFPRSGLTRRWPLLFLLDSNGDTLGVVSPRTYDPEMLRLFMRLLPPTESDETPMSVREVLRRHPYIAPFSVKLVIRFTLIVLVGYAGLGLVLAGLAAL
jgi:hypothetical protein